MVVVPVPGILGHTLFKESGLGNLGLLQAKSSAAPAGSTERRGRARDFPNQQIRFVDFAE